MSDDKTDFDKLWHDWFMDDAFRVERLFTQAFHLLPHNPRCKLCASPFEGVGGAMMRSVFGRRRSKLNPHFCNICEDYAREHPGGAEVEMSMLFADVRGSTALSEQMSPIEFQKLINRFYVESTRVIVDEYGLVEKLAGDAVAAFWGTGFAGKDYVTRTIQTAQKIQRVMGRQGIPVGIGVHTGVAYFGAMGAPDGIVDISAIGDEVNTAARIASKAAAGEILVSEAALDKAKLKPDKWEMRQLELKGISEVVKVYVLSA